MARKEGNRPKITLACTECKRRNYNTVMTVELINPIAMDEGLRFAIREGGRTVGAGRVTKILK